MTFIKENPFTKMETRERTMYPNPVLRTHYSNRFKYLQNSLKPAYEGVDSHTLSISLTNIIDPHTAMQLAT